MSAAERYTIGQLARTAEIPTSTVRYYERIGLLAPENRSLGNYRLYGKSSMHRLLFIRAAKSIGFTLEDIAVLIGAHDSHQPRCRDVQDLIEARLTDIDERLRNLRHIQRVLESSLDKCKRSDQAGCCHVIESLQQ